MFMTFEDVSKLINGGKLLHIAGTEALLRKLPQGKWIGGSTEYFMANDGGKVSGELLFVTEFPYENFTIISYHTKDIDQIAVNAYDNGFSIVIVPFDSAVHKEYAEKAAGFEGMFMKNITGWVSGINLGTTNQTPIAVNGMTGMAHEDQAVVLHMEVPDGKVVSIGIINIFEQDESSPAIQFIEDGFSAKKCLVDGTVNFYAPVFSNITYRIAKKIVDYVGEFNNHLMGYKDTKAVFSCNCILNFLYGELEGKRIDAFAGAITFGEIAYQLVNQTLVYVTVNE